MSEPTTLSRWPPKSLQRVSTGATFHDPEHLQPLPCIKKQQMQPIDKLVAHLKKVDILDTKSGSDLRL
jgi:hypothetical protein